MGRVHCRDLKSLFSCIKGVMMLQDRNALGKVNIRREEEGYVVLYDDEIRETGSGDRND